MHRWSAYGVATSDLGQTFERSYYLNSPFDARQLDAGFRKLEEETTRFFDPHIGDSGAVPELRFSADVKYALQFYAVEVAVPNGEVSPAGVAKLLEDFEEPTSGATGPTPATWREG